mmetsp:Transcript_6965/g.17436  ORF Transcript_6965/g.17436 Transcript_6965/m.17436 type:complete len:211 (+) Transcript_6965:365-997(+)
MSWISALVSASPRPKWLSAETPRNSVSSSCWEEVMSSRAPGKSPAARSCWMVGCVRHTACTRRSFACSAAVLARCRTSRGKLSDFSTRLTSSARMRKRSASICDRPKATCWLRWSYDSSASKKPSDLVDTSLSSVNSTWSSHCASLSSITIVACGCSGGEKKAKVSGWAKSKSLRKQISGTPAKLGVSWAEDEVPPSPLQPPAAGLFAVR